MKWKIGGEGKGHLSSTYCILSALYIITINITTNTTESVIILPFFFLFDEKISNTELEMGGVPFGFCNLKKES